MIFKSTYLYVVCYGKGYAAVLSRVGSAMMLAATLHTSNIESLSVLQLPYIHFRSTLFCVDGYSLDDSYQFVSVCEP